MLAVAEDAVPAVTEDGMLAVAEDAVPAVTDDGMLAVARHLREQYPSLRDRPYEGRPGRGHPTATEAKGETKARPHVPVLLDNAHKLCLGEA
jgi:hypothetical protein